MWRAEVWLVQVVARSAAGPDELPIPTTDGGQANDTIDEILRRPEFAPPRRNFLEEARDWVLEKIAEALVRAFGAGGGEVVGWVVLIAAALLAGSFLYRFARGARGDARSMPRFEDDPIRPPAEWRRDAERHERAGEWRLALRCRYRALVAELAARGLVEEIPGRTTGEYRAEVATSVPNAAPEFAGATELFELAWYGDWPTGEDENRRFRDLTDKVLAGARV